MGRATATPAAPQWAAGVAAIIQAHPPCVRASPGCLQQKSPVLRCIVLFECVFGNLQKNGRLVGGELFSKEIF